MEEKGQVISTGILIPVFLKWPLRFLGKIERQPIPILLLCQWPNEGGIPLNALFHPRFNSDPQGLLCLRKNHFMKQLFKCKQPSEQMAPVYNPHLPQNLSAKPVPYAHVPIFVIWDNNSVLGEIWFVYYVKGKRTK